MSGVVNITGVGVGVVGAVFEIPAWGGSCETCRMPADLAGLRAELGRKAAKSASLRAEVSRLRQAAKHLLDADRQSTIESDLRALIARMDPSGALRRGVRDWYARDAIGAVAAAEYDRYLAGCDNLEVTR